MSPWLRETERADAVSLNHGSGPGRVPHEVIAMFLSRAAAALTVVVCLAACQSSAPVTFARPKPPTAKQAVGGVGYAATATFNAPVVNPNTWTGTPMGTGTYSAMSTPPQSGGNQSIAADDQGVYYIVIGNLTAGPGNFF